MQNTDDSHKMSSSLVLNGVFNEKKQSKKHRSNDQGGSSRSSSSSQGSSRNGALVLRTSSSSEEDDKAQPRVKKTKRPKKPLTRHQFSVEDEDDERTDSADEGDKPFNPPFTQSNSYPGPMLRPLSPMMSVGYGDLRATHTNAHKDDVIDITPVLESPNPQVPPCDPLSPDIQGGDSVLPLAGNVTGASVLPSPITNTLPFAGWYQPPLYSPFCGGSSSMATTPAAGGENGSFIPPGTNVMLHATICNESEGILIINVRWRNKSFSGSLIDLNRHQWAPPKLAEGFTDLQIQVKDLYKKQESEKVVVDIDGDTAVKDKDADVDRNMEITVTKEDHTNKSGFSDISDASDSESKLLEKKASVPVVTADDSNHNKPAIALPSFDAVKSPQPEFRREGAKNSTKEDAPSSPAEQPKPTSSKPHSNLSLPYIGDSSAEEGRSLDHHNLNTLVDVATKMKPVTGQGDAKPPDSDSSGSGSVSPEKKKALSDKQQEGGKSADNPVVSKQPDTPGLGPQLFNFTIAPISPGDSDPRNTKRPMKPPPPPDHLRAQWSATDSKPSVIPSIVSFSNIQHGNSPALYHQAPSVIQSGSGKPRKRKLLAQNETNKRVSPPPIKDGLPPPIKDGLPFVRDKIPLPPLPMSYTSSRPEAPNTQRRDHHHNDQPPPGFIFDPSLPMPYEYQLLSYKEQLKSSEEAAGDESHGFSKIIKRPKPIETHDALSVSKPTRSPSPNLRRPLLHSSMAPHDQRIQFSPHGNKPERPPSKDSHSVVKSHKKHPIQRKSEYPTHTIKKDPDGPPQPLFMSTPQGVFMPQGLQLSSAPSSQTVTLPQMSHWPMATAIPQGGKPIKSDPSEHHSSSQHRSTPSPHLPVAKNKPHIVDNKPHIHNQHHGNKHDSSRHHISSNASSNNLSQISPTNTLRNGAILPQQVVSEEWLKQMQMMQLEQLQNAGATPTIPMALHHQELAMWQSQLMQLMNAGRGDQALQIQQQLALQQQQQMIQSDAMAQAFASPGMVPFMPLPGFQGMVPYLPPTQKRDS